MTVWVILSYHEEIPTSKSTFHAYLKFTRHYIFPRELKEEDLNPLWRDPPENDYMSGVRMSWNIWPSSRQAMSLDVKLACLYTLLKEKPGKLTYLTLLKALNYVLNMCFFILRLAFYHVRSCDVQEDKL